jgi:hypothetical protein
MILPINIHQKHLYLKDEPEVFVVLPYSKLKNAQTLVSYSLLVGQYDPKVAYLYFIIQKLYLAGKEWAPLVFHLSPICEKNKIQHTMQREKLGYIVYFMLLKIARLNGISSFPLAKLIVQDFLFSF